MSIRFFAFVFPILKRCPFGFNRATEMKTGREARAAARSHPVRWRQALDRDLWGSHSSHTRRPFRNMVR